MCFLTDGSKSQSKLQTSQKPENSWVILEWKIPKRPRDDSSIVFPEMGDLFESLGKGGIQWWLLSHWQILLPPLASPQGGSCSADVLSPVLGQEQFESEDLFNLSNPNAWIDWWMDGWWIDERKEGWMNGEMDGWKEGRREGWMGGWKEGRREGWMDGRKEGGKDGWMDGWIEGRMGGWIESRWMNVTESWCEDIWGILYWNLRGLTSSARSPLLLLPWCLWFFLGNLCFQSCLGTQAF